MPGIIDMFKNYEIDSEEDIPVEYREEIEQRLQNEPKEIQFEATKLTPGIEGNVLSNMHDIRGAFGDNSVYYFGHGTPGDATILRSILEQGLKTTVPKEARFYGNTLRGLDSTTIVFGSGNDQLFEQEQDKLNNWPHKNSQNVVIISLPKDYVLRIMDIGTFADLYKPFYIGSEEQGFYLRPEFIKGIYNAKTRTFIENDNFYQNLDEETQKKLFEDIKKAYIKSYAEVSHVNPRETIEPLPFNEEEMNELSMEWFKEQLKKLREDKMFKEQDLDSELYDITESMTKSDFDNTTRSIKAAATRNMEKEAEIDDGWEVGDDDWD